MACGASAAFGGATFCLQGDGGPNVFSIKFFQDQFFIIEFVRVDFFLVYFVYLSHLPSYILRTCHLWYFKVFLWNGDWTERINFDTVHSWSPLRGQGQTGHCHMGNLLIHPKKNRLIFEPSTSQSTMCKMHRQPRSPALSPSSSKAHWRETWFHKLPKLRRRQLFTFRLR